MLLTLAPLYSPPEGSFHARLACLIHTANVRSEPGSNPSVRCLIHGWDGGHVFLPGHPTQEETLARPLAQSTFLKGHPCFQRAGDGPDPTQAAASIGRVRIRLVSVELRSPRLGRGDHRHFEARVNRACSAKWISCEERVSSGRANTYAHAPVSGLISPPLRGGLPSRQTPRLPASCATERSPPARERRLQGPGVRSSADLGYSWT